jgi:AcrR family transcriptional regulator
MSYGPGEFPMARRRTARPQGREPKRPSLADPHLAQPAAGRAGAGAKTVREISRYEKRGAAILDAAAKLFNANGVRGATLAGVAECVGLGTTAISYYYPTREHLAAACFLRAIEVFDELFAQAVQAHAPNERLSQAVTLYFERLKDVALGLRAPVVAFDDILSLKPPHAEAVFAAYTSMFRRVRALFGDYGNTRLARIQQNARAHLFLSLLLWVPGWIHRYEPEDYGRVASRVNDLLRHGLFQDAANWDWTASSALRMPVVAAEDQREPFLRAATSLMNERGYRGASIDKIAAHLNLTKGAFYHHNADKEEVVTACFERTFDIIRQAQNTADEQGRNGRTKLCRAISMLVRFQLSNEGPLLRTSALHSVGQATRVDMVRRMNRLSDRFAAFIVDGMMDGSIRPADPMVAGEFVGAMINAAAELPRWVPTITADTAPSLFAEPLLTGILSCHAR